MTANEPLDLTRRFGEAWCVTVTALPVDAALAAMGAQEVLAHQVTPDHALILQLDSTDGWVGTGSPVLLALAPRATACTITCLPNVQEAWFAEPDHGVSGVDPVTGRCWGACGPDLSAALDRLGYSADADEPADDLAQYTVGQCAALIMHAATGLHLRAEHFDALTRP